MGRLKVASLSTPEDAMNPNRRQALRTLQRAAFFAGIAAATMATPADAFFFQTVTKPEAQHFGFGPRESAEHRYTVYLKPMEPLRLRKLQNLRILVLDAAGRPVENARISVDGGMPEHGHGLPTQPRVQGSLGGGMYDIEGLRFSMGGWWEVKLAIDSPQGADRVTFNLSL
jgi:hypothetical protein